MPSPENLAQLNHWIAENVAILTAALNAARTPPAAQQVEQNATRFLQALETKDRAALTALAAIRQEVAAGRPYRQHHTTWTHRLGQLDQETAAHNQVHAVLHDQITATRQMLAQLQQLQRPAAQPQHRDTPSPRSAASPQPPAAKPIKPSFAKGLLRFGVMLPLGLGLILLLSIGTLGILTFGALTYKSSGAPITQTAATPRPVAAIQATQGPATEAADLLQTRNPSTQAPAAARTATPSQAASLPTAAPPPTAAPAPATTRPPTPTPTPATSANANANLRTGPGANYPISGALTAGQIVKVIARNPAGDWYQLTGDAWIYGALLNAAPVVSIAAIIPLPPPPTSTPAPPAPTRAVVPPSFAPARSCCKICTTGKACGDSCIASNKTCHVGIGCACNG